MLGRAVAVVFALALVGATGAAPVGPTPPAPGRPTAHVTAVVPDPVADDDRGERVTVWFPPGTTLAGWSLHDGETTVHLPNRTVAGTVHVVADGERPAAIETPPLNATVIEVPDLALSNAGERIELRRSGRLVDVIAYDDTEEGHRLTRTGWTTPGTTDVAVTTARNVTARTFVLPDAPEPPVDVLRRADDRILLAGYTFTSRRAASALADAADRGVDVHVLVDGAPVGGMTRREARLLDALVTANVTVTVLGGPRARYDFHHAKYAVVDDSALVTTENWKPAGTGGRSSRGWGVVLTDAKLAGSLADVFRADATWRDGIPWREYRTNQTFEPATPANGTYPTRFRATRVRADEVRLLVGPDNAERAVLSVLRSADRTIRVQQVSVEPGTPLLRATVAAARRGVAVRIALSSAWYTREENRRLVRRLNRQADREDIPLSATLVEPRSRFEKVHAKGVVVDGEQVVLGSVNWNNNSLRENREVAVVLEGDPVGDYYARVFRADWRGGAWRLPFGLVGALGVGVVAAGTVVRRRVAFD